MSEYNRTISVSSQDMKYIIRLAGKIQDDTEQRCTFPQALEVIIHDYKQKTLDKPDTE